jgi:hypothetical protein
MFNGFESQQPNHFVFKDFIPPNVLTTYGFGILPGSFRTQPPESFIETTHRTTFFVGVLSAKLNCIRYMPLFHAVCDSRSQKASLSKARGLITIQNSRVKKWF